MSRMVKFGLAVAAAMLVTVTASDIFAQCCNDDCGRTGMRGRWAARRANRNCYTNTCCAPQNNCCAPQVDCCNTAPACGCATAAPVNNCCDTGCNSCGCAAAHDGCNKGCCSRGLFGRRGQRGNYVSTGCCNSGCNTGCDTGCCGGTSGCPGCAQGVIQGSSEGSIVVPEASGQPVEPATVPSDT